MNKKKIISGTVGLVVIGLVWIYISFWGAGRVESEPVIIKEELVDGVAQTAAGEFLVEIEDYDFDPALITIRRDQTIRWVNQDAVPHQIQSEGFAAGRPLETGESFVHAFTAVGEYDYTCAVHPGMKGKVIVTE